MGMPADSGAVTMNVSLPQPLKRYVDGKVASGIYGSASEFVREVIPTGRDGMLTVLDPKDESLIKNSLAEAQAMIGKPVE